MIGSYGSLFSGIGGLDLAVESVFPDAECAWQCEADPWRRGILERRWGACQFDDVRRMERHHETCCMDDDCDCGAGVQPVDLICGGFPCQDVATNGKRAGIIDGERSGLWSEFARLVGVLRPGLVFVENVPGLADRGGLGVVLGDLAALGFDAEWTCIRASDAGGLHKRRRIFLLAYTNEVRSWRPVDPGRGIASGTGARRGGVSRRWSADRSAEWAAIVGWGAGESGVGRVAHGLPAKLARRQLSALGDAVSPQQASLALRMLLARLETQRPAELSPGRPSVPDRGDTHRGGSLLTADHGEPPDADDRDPVETAPGAANEQRENNP